MNPYSYQNTNNISLITNYKQPACMQLYMYKIIICSSKIKNSWYNIQICKLYNHGHMHMPACKPRCNSPKTCNIVCEILLCHTHAHTHTHARMHTHTHHNLFLHIAFLSLSCMYCNFRTFTMIFRGTKTCYKTHV